uniref:ATP-dependent RNA helicase SUPV3L1, mitochondrial n=1 Tax=Leptobrachium leishanense TaxID=445787 RepID=A0A8C5Q8I6_9ANUR
MYLSRFVRSCLQPVSRGLYYALEHRAPALTSACRKPRAGCRSITNGTKPPDTSLFVPVLLSLPTSSDINIGAELTQTLKKTRLFHQAFISFRKFAMEASPLPVELHIILSDICAGVGHVDDLFPSFLVHAKQVFPMLDCMDELRRLSDLRLPPNWYPEARAIQRKIIFHSGPTNSGKTYHAIQRYLSAKSGVYCGPLKLLAHEIYQKTNESGVPCDLITGEEVVCVDPEGKSAAHAACTIEMCSVNAPYEVAVIDEIQMIRDPSRGWAWTRALLGLCAEEIHVCGEAAAINLVTELMFTTGEEVEVRTYDRLTPLTVLDQAIESLDNLRPGDCIVCFNKNDIYSVSRKIELQGLECAVIYGSLPPGTKLAQAKKFNDPDDPCKILVATDAIGMGLNLSIKRIIFNSLFKPNLNEKGEREIDRISTSQALQISGRAGRFSSMYKDGEVTTMSREDLPLLKEILSKGIVDIETAGLHPTAEQIEMFAYCLPEATLSNLIDIFVSLSHVDGLYFVCNVEDFKFVADMIQHIPLNLRVRYVFCTAPINRKQPFVCTSLLKFARQFSKNEPLTFDWVCRHIYWPVACPKNIKDLVHLESVHDVLDLYLWLSYRFMDMFPDANLVRQIQKELDSIIRIGVFNITRLIRQSNSTLPLAEHSGADLLKEGVLQDGNLNEKPQLQTRIGRAKARPTAPQKVDGSLASRLIEQGLLTPDMLQQLEKEWLKHKAGNPTNSTKPNSIKGKK